MEQDRAMLTGLFLLLSPWVLFRRSFMEHECFAFETIEDQTVDSPRHCNFSGTVFRRCAITGRWEHNNLERAVYEDCAVSAEFTNCAGVE